MLHIILLILKIIGILLAVILGLVLVVIGVLLFVPIRYRASGIIDQDIGKKEFQIRFHWFFHILSGHANYKDNKFSWKVRFFWKKWSDTEKELPIEETQNKTQNETQKRKKKNKKKYTIRKICDKMKSIYQFITDENHKEAWNVVKRQLFRLLRVLRPKKLKGQLLFGCEDPYNTGKILAILSVLYPWYADAIEIEPNFEEKVLKTDFSAAGKIHCIWLVIIIWNLYFDKNVMDSYQDWKKLKG